MDSNMPLNSHPSAGAKRTPVTGKEQGVPDATHPADPSGGGLIAFIRRRPLTSYFLLTYALAWLGWTPFVLSESGLGVLRFQADPLLLLGSLGPCAAGFIMAAITGGKPGVRDLLRRLIQWRVGWQWYLFVLVVVPGVPLLGFLVLPGVAKTLYLPSVQFALQFVLFFLQFLLTVNLIQALEEEPGWRGFALPRLQQRYGPLLGTLILGSLWAGYHLPLFLTTAFADRTPFGFAVFLLASIAISLVLTWVYNSARGSVLLTILAHAAIIASGIASGAMNLFPADILEKDTYPAITIGLGALVVLLIVVTRGRLGLASKPE
ncbi:MAG TPA: type II CAAX endopeptidase family protein [Ktedonobacterales bacterium]